MTDSVIYMDLIMDEAKVNEADRETNEFSYAQELVWWKNAGNAKSHTHFIASSVGAVCVLCSYVNRIYLKRRLRWS